jgi:hypothetical protein
MTERQRHGWDIYRGVTCVACPDCAFTFDADHENTDGTGYTCPACVAERDDLLAAVERERKRRRAAEQDAAALLFLIIQSGSGPLMEAAAARPSLVAEEAPNR